MQEKVLNFKEYFEKQYEVQIEQIAKNYVYNHRDRFHTKYIPEPTTCYYAEQNVMGVSFRDSKVKNQILFHLAVIVYAEIKGRAGRYKNSNYDEDTAEEWIGISCSATLNDGLKDVKFLDVDRYSRQAFDKEKTLSKYLVPYFYSKELDGRAEEFLTKYCAVALKTPMELPINDIAKKMGLKIFYSPLTDSIFGRTYFADSQEQVYNPKGELETRLIKKGSILMNHNVSFMNSVGSENNTIIHECIHWEYHKKFFELQHLLNPSQKSMSCTVVDNFIKNGTLTEEIEWMEWQANALAPRILMPANTTKAKFKEKLEEIKTANSQVNKSEMIELAVNELAKFFKVTSSAMKVRLLQLGYKSVVGVNCYVDKGKKESYYFEPSKIEESQTYIIDFVDALILRFTNPVLGKLIDERKIVYADGFYVVNHPKYVTLADNGKTILTEYAREHVDECCLVFNIIETFKSNLDKSYYSMCFLCRNADANSNVRTEVDMTSVQNSRIIGVCGKSDIAFEELAETDEILKEMTGTFPECLEVVLDKLGYKSNQAIGDLANLDAHTIKNYKDGIRVPELTKLLAICAGLELHPRITYKLMERAGIVIGGRGLQSDMALMFLIESCYHEGLDSWNKRLKEMKQNIQLP